MASFLKIAGTTYGDISVTLNRETIDVTSERPTADKSWRHTDSEGHEHYWDHGYPTLDFVIDEQHWCDGTEGIYNHDPHMAIDEAHYECKQCRQVIEPAMHPPFYPQVIGGPVSAEIEGTQSSGRLVRAFLLPAQVDELRSLLDGGADVQPFLDNISEDQIIESQLST